MTSIMRFYYTKILSNLFGGYRDVNNIEQFWHYMENDLINNMYWEYDYGIDAKKQKSYNCPDGDNSIGPCSLTPEDRNVLYENNLKMNFLYKFLLSLSCQKKKVITTF